jgi:hypothetical protein
VDPDSTLFDAELDTPRHRPRTIPDDSVANCQRLIINPFLAILGWLAAGALLRYSLRGHDLALYLTALFGLSIPFLLIQFHCLDCRATGWYIRAGRHVCAGVFARWACGAGGSRWPGGRTQLLIWLYVLAAFSLFYVIRLREPR